MILLRNLGTVEMSDFPHSGALHVSRIRDVFRQHVLPSVSVSLSLSAVMGCSKKNLGARPFVSRLDFLAFFLIK
jgi:hypothetical protein